MDVDDTIIEELREAYKKLVLFTPPRIQVMVAQRSEGTIQRLEYWRIKAQLLENSMKATIRYQEDDDGE